MDGGGRESGEKKETQRTTDGDRGKGGIAETDCRSKGLPKETAAREVPSAYSGHACGKGRVNQNGSEHSKWLHEIDGHLSRFQGQGKEAKKREGPHGEQKEKGRIPEQTETLREEERVQRHKPRAIVGKSVDRKTHSAPKREITNKERNKGGDLQSRS
ncbi:hypothetical protein NDU88_003792 [Pleurodeles waltl]|uniref:Uncharacterized protein n=1 Tax=Pleurodeles waltl TaxID=8319 RepID=A0AAV7TSA0_PLEWA|nr:hypothetical protein NDU88_003792 [Pleurodeles waltl]